MSGLAPLARVPPRIGRGRRRDRAPDGFADPRPRRALSPPPSRKMPVGDLLDHAGDLELAVSGIGIAGFARGEICAPWRASRRGASGVGLDRGRSVSRTARSIAASTSGRIALDDPAHAGGSRGQRCSIASRLSRIGCSRGMSESAPKMVAKKPGGSSLAARRHASRRSSCRAWDRYRRSGGRPRAAPGASRSASIAGRKGALASTEPSISTAFSALAAAHGAAAARARKASRPGQSAPRFVEHFVELADA